MAIPTIDIKHGSLLQGVFIDFIKQIPELKEKAENPPMGKVAEEMVNERKVFWDKESDLILNAIQEVTGLQFSRNVIDVYLVYGYRHAFSDPLVISFGAKEIGFVDTLTHELIHHILLNSKEEIARNIKWLIKRFPEIESRRTLIHIIVHAVHKEIYLEHLKSPERLAQNIEKVSAWVPYKESWDIVEKIGHKEIIAMFKTDNNLK